MPGLKPLGRGRLGRVLPNVITVVIVAGITAADVMDGPLAYWKMAAWVIVWLWVAAACTAVLRR